MEIQCLRTLAVFLILWKFAQGYQDPDSVLTSSDALNFTVAIPEEHDENSAKMDQRGFMWELISSSSDVIPLLLDKNSTLLQSINTTTESTATTSPITSHRNVQMRLQKLSFYFNALRIHDEDCRQRLLCEVSRDPPKFSPMSVAFLDEIRYNGDESELSTRLLATNEGAQLLKYIQAAQRGNDLNGCDIWTFRCPKPTSSMINYQTLLMWREVSKWLTIQMVAKRA